MKQSQGEHLAELKARVGRGEYRVDAPAVAAAIVQRLWVKRALRARTRLCADVLLDAQGPRPRR